MEQTFLYDIKNCDDKVDIQYIQYTQSCDNKNGHEQFHKHQSSNLVTKMKKKKP